MEKIWSYWGFISIKFHTRLNIISMLVFKETLPQTAFCFKIQTTWVVTLASCSYVVIYAQMVYFFSLQFFIKSKTIASIVHCLLPTFFLSKIHWYFYQEFCYFSPEHNYLYKALKIVVQCVSIIWLPLKYASPLNKLFNTTTSPLNCSVRLQNKLTLQCVARKKRDTFQ